MNIYEFRAWFDGFTTGKDGLSAADVEVVKDKLADVPFARGGIVKSVPRYFCGEMASASFRPPHLRATTC